MNKSIPSDETETPPELFAELASRYALGTFDLDAAASHANALAVEYYTQDGCYTRADGGRQLTSHDGLSGAWYGAVWCNPPYSDIRPWVEKAWRETGLGTAATVVMLLPARTDAPWWRELVEPYREGGGVLGAGPESYPGASDVRLDVEFRGRVHFLRDGRPIPATDAEGRPLLKKDGTPRRGSPRFGIAVLVWSRRPAE